MNELDHAQDIGLHGPLADKALKYFLAQVRRWKIAMPVSKPLVLDFGLNDFARTGLIECWIVNEVQAGYCGKYMFLADGQECPAHCHKIKHESFFAVCGSFSVKLDGKRRVLRPGQTLAIPPRQFHSFRGIGPALMLELSMPCRVNDNYFENQQIMTWLRQALSQPRPHKELEPDR